MFETKGALGSTVGRLRMRGTFLAHCSQGLLAHAVVKMCIQMQGSFRRCVSREGVIILVADLIANVLVAFRCNITHYLSC